MPKLNIQELLLLSIVRDTNVFNKYVMGSADGRLFIWKRTRNEFRANVGESTKASAAGFQLAQTLIANRLGEEFHAKISKKEDMKRTRRTSSSICGSAMSCAKCRTL